jgi:rhodanese-related sulfurtransferase
MRLLMITSILLMLGKTACTQIPEERPSVNDPAFDDKISRTISFTVPTIGVQELNELQQQEDVVLLDARELEEYEVSHIPDALYIGYKKPDYSILKNVPKDKEIVVYCSIGYRSEKIGEHLQKQGFTSVKNLYGSIFEWANQGHPLVDKNQEMTKKIHTYNKNWSKWVDEKRAQKVW